MQEEREDFSENKELDECKDGCASEDMFNTQKNSPTVQSFDKFELFVFKHLRGDIGYITRGKV